MSTKELGTRLKLLKVNTRINHTEKDIKESIEKIIYSYKDIFILPGDAIPFTDLMNHKIILKEYKKRSENKTTDAHSRVFEINTTCDKISSKVYHTETDTIIVN